MHACAPERCACAKGPLSAGMPDEMPKLDQHLALRLARLSVALILPSLTTCLRLWGVEAQHDGITDLTTVCVLISALPCMPRAHLQAALLSDASR